MPDPMLPVPYRVVERRVETRDSATLCLEPIGEPIKPFAAGQFTMLYAHGIGEIAISISGVVLGWRRLRRRTPRQIAPN